MRVHIVESYEELSTKAASIVSSQVILKPNSVLGLATGSTPEGMYRNLVQLYKRDLIDFSEVISFNLDEYIGLDANHQQSYTSYMFNNLFNHVNFKEEHINIPIEAEDKLQEFCLKYDKKIERAGGIDLQVLGIGTNGHIGFNEPDNKLKTGTHIVDLAEETIEANSRFFNSKEEVPKQAVSMGMSSIMGSKKILLLASGENKAEAIKNTINGKITTEVPSSLLQLHPDVTIVVDKAAAKLIK
ncbi:glucosamine-6-phosphate deaminase [Orenia metallireducens]|uniref:Glucosamine-6-phosphate deaminase n=1 Tax=Orenia metallireducens TaxID=1413210 RepID=A0A285GGN9_9FIRM|nr:glucosamine-6-phosphate deaminase [Orenia metallireducens]PRX30471.1 glucosamine-6-phosphate deaminase [Orenia metallireducens]SNY22737.1 glucosamine-6-phosphate deaminase [Orenia metallireducens]